MLAGRHDRATCCQGDMTHVCHHGRRQGTVRGSQHLLCMAGRHGMARREGDMAGRQGRATWQAGRHGMTGRHDSRMTGRHDDKRDMAGSGKRATWRGDMTDSGGVALHCLSRRPSMSPLFRWLPCRPSSTACHAAPQRATKGDMAGRATWHGRATWQRGRHDSKGDMVWSSRRATQPSS